MTRMICIKNFTFACRRRTRKTLKSYVENFPLVFSPKIQILWAKEVDKRNAVNSLKLKCGRRGRIFRKIFSSEHAGNGEVFDVRISIHFTHAYLNFVSLCAFPEIRKNLKNPFLGCFLFGFIIKLSWMKFKYFIIFLTKIKLNLKNSNLNYYFTAFEFVEIKFISKSSTPFVLDMRWLLGVL